MDIYNERRLSKKSGKYIVSYRVRSTWDFRLNIPPSILEEFTAPRALSHSR